jgi:hypothetical protein
MTKRGLARDPYLDSLVGLRLTGGCRDCTAYQTFDRDELGIYACTIHHDDTCPRWKLSATT